MTQQSTTTAHPTARRRLYLLLGCWAIATVCLTLFGVQALANPTPLWIVALAAPIGIAAIYLHPHVATFLCVFLIYSNIPVVAAQFHGAPYAGVAAVPGLLLLPIAYFLWVRREGVLFPVEAILVVALVVVQSLGVAFSRDPDFSFGILVRSLGEGLGLFLLLINAVRTPEVMRGCLWALLATGAFMGLITGHQYLTDSYHSNYAGFAQSDLLGFEKVNSRGHTVTVARAAGPVGEKNRYAQNMMMLLPLGICLAMTEAAAWRRWLAWLATAITAIGWSVAFSRGAVVGLAGTILLATLLGYIRPRYLCGMVLLAMMALAVSPQYRERVTSLVSVSQFLTNKQTPANADGSLKGRATIMLAAFRVFAENPVLGVGPGMFPFYAREYGKANGYSALEGKWQAHNLYLGLGADYGVLGLSCFFGAILFNMYNLHQLRRACLKTHPTYAAIATALLLALLIYLTTGMFLHFSYVRYFWTIFGLSTAASYIIRIALREKPNMTIAAIA